jgi:hypothetical protein
MLIRNVSMIPPFLCQRQKFAIERECGGMERFNKFDESLASHAHGIHVFAQT